MMEFDFNPTAECDDPLWRQSRLYEADHGNGAELGKARRWCYESGTFFAFAPLVLDIVKTASASSGQQAAYDYQAQLAGRQAERERQIAERDSEEFRRRERKRLASFRARRAASGIAMRGSPLLVDDELVEEIEFGAATIRDTGQTKASNLEAQARLSRLRGENTGRQGFFKTGQSLLTGFEQLHGIK